MGGWMDYERVRERSGLTRKPLDDPDPYWREVPSAETVSWSMLCGDLNRMERDYLDPAYPQPPFAIRPEGSDPGAECAAATGVPIDTVRAVLAFVFRGVRPSPDTAVPAGGAAPEIDWAVVNPPTGLMADLREELRDESTAPGPSPAVQEDATDAL